MKTEFNHAANDSPRSGSTKKVAPVVGAAIVIAIIVIALGLKMLGKHQGPCPTALREYIRLSERPPLRGRSFLREPQ
jgi:hypothetical protein